MMRIHFLLTHVVTVACGLFHWLCGVSFAEPVSELRTLHVVLALDTDAHNVQQVIAHDQELLTRLFKELRTGREERFQITMLTGNAVTPESVRNYFRSKRLSRDEGIMFIYSGHGGFDIVSGQFLAMERGRMDRSSLRSAISSTGAGLKIILTNCCSNISAIQPTIHAYATPRLEWDVCKNLLFQCRGLVDVSAAEETTFAYGTRQGSHFINALDSCLRTDSQYFDYGGDGFVDWAEFTGIVINRTRQAHSGQKPQIYLLGYDDENGTAAHFQAVAEQWKIQEMRYAVAIQAHLDHLQTSTNKAARLRKIAQLAQSTAACCRNEAQSLRAAANAIRVFMPDQSAAAIETRATNAATRATTYETLAVSDIPQMIRNQAR